MTFRWSDAMDQESDLGEKNAIVDMLLGKKDGGAVDSDTLIVKIQKRVWEALKKGYEYSGPFDESEEILRANVSEKIDMAILYVDLVGSTTMTLELPEEKTSTIISSFAQEMAYVVRQHGGYVLKFVGDAVIAFYMSEGSLKTVDCVLECAKSMITAIHQGINPVLKQYDYPDLRAKIGIDYGSALVVRYGADERRAPVDLLGPVLNIAAKIQAHAKPDEILVGSDIYERLHPSTQAEFEKIAWGDGEWNYRSRLTGKVYDVYRYVWKDKCPHSP